MSHSSQQCIDIHVHLGTSPDGGRVTLKSLKRYLDQHRFSHLVLFPIDELNSGRSFFKLNRQIAKLASKDSRVIGFARLDPRDPEAALREVKSAKGLGLKGFKLHPRSENFHAAHVRDLMPEIAKTGLPIVMHASHEGNCHPVTWEGVFLSYPKTAFILAHGAKDAYRELAKVSKKCKNVFADTTTLSYNRTTYLFKEMGAERLIFGSDYPYSHPDLEKLKYELILKSDQASKQKIYFNNAKKILGV